jgi:hypothetical protein
MVALTFDARQFKPQYGGGDTGLPDGKFKTVIVNSRKVDVEKMGNYTGSYLELTHTVIEGELKGQTQVDRLNLNHSNPVTVEIANQQLSAYCHVLGVFTFTDSSQLHNIPMGIEVGRQIDKTTKLPTSYSEIKKVFDANGNEPGKAGTGPQVQHQQHAPPPPNQPPPAGVTADGGGTWGSGPPATQPPADTGGGNWGVPGGQTGGAGGGWTPSGSGAPGGGNPPAWGAR